MKTSIIVQYSIILLDYNIMEDDILSYEDNDQIQDYEYEDAVGNYFLWDLDSTSGTVPIPYLIDSRSTPELREKVHAAIAEYHKKTCIR